MRTTNRKLNVLRYFRYITAVAMLAGIHTLYGQQTDLPKQKSALKIGLGMTGTMYQGDLSDNETLFHRIYPGANVSLQSDGPKNLQLQMNAGFGKFAEQYDAEPPSRPTGVFPIDFVETTFFYGDLRVKYRLLKGHRIRPYASVGAGFLIFSPKDKNGKFLSDAILTRPEGEEYNTAIPQVPASIGFEAQLTPLLSTSLDYTFRYTPTDYLDNVGQLGTRDGDDRLHGIQLTLYFSLSGSNLRKPVREEPPVDIFARANGSFADTLITKWDPQAEIVPPAPVKVPEDKPEAVVEQPVKSAPEPKPVPDPQPDPEPIKEDIVEIEPEIVPEVVEEQPAASVLPKIEKKDPIPSLTQATAATAPQLSSRKPNPSMMEVDPLEVDFNSLENKKPGVDGFASMETDPMPASLKESSVDLSGLDAGKVEEGDLADLDSLNAQAYWDNKAWYAWSVGDVFYYRIKAGDTYQSLNERFHISKEVLQDVNKLAGERPPVGRLLRFPDLRKWFDSGTEDVNIIEEDEVKEDETLEVIAVNPDDGESFTDPLEAAPKVDWAQKEEEAMKAGKYIYYQVKSFDNLNSISERFKTRVETIKKLNFMEDDRIYEDTYLRLPDLGIPAENNP